MATPSRVHASSTPKNTFAATPTYVTPSPRPTTSAAMGRPFSHKSPPIKTPASIHGHSHNVSTSSHPSSTPLPVPSFGEDALAFNSPAAALMASMGSHGLTPLPSGTDGLGISTDLPHITSKEGSVIGARNVEEDKSRRLQEVLQMLKTRVAGRAVCREGVERIAKLSSFTYAWLDDNNLSIAGNFVDLEIVFDDQNRDLVKDVVLKVTTSGTEDHEQSASAVLKQDLSSEPPTDSVLPWNNLDRFSTNLSRLAKLDQLSNGINCFEAVGGLYHSFQRIWEEEKKRLGSKHTMSRICLSALGRPAMNKRRKIGLGFDYWVEKRKLQEAELERVTRDSMDLDENDLDLEDDQTRPWIKSARVECETGYPAIRVASDWLGEDVYLPDETEDGMDNGGAITEHKLPNLGWIDPPPTLVASSESKEEPDAMIIDGAGAGISLPKPPNIHFTCNIDGPMLVPINLISAMIGQGLMVLTHTQNTMNFPRALDTLYHTETSSSNKVNNEGQNAKVESFGAHWHRNLITYNKDGDAMEVKHSYGLYTSSGAFYHPIQSIIFEHPRQLVWILPVIRQFTLFWSVLAKLVPNVNMAVQKAAPKETPVEVGRSKKSRKPVRKSNMKPQASKLDSLLNGGVSLAEQQNTNHENGHRPVSVDITVDFTPTSPPTPKFELVIPLPGGRAGGNGSQHSRFATIAIEIEFNGQFVVTSTHGLPFDGSAVSLQKMADVLTISEDLGVLVEWILGKV